MSKGKFDNYVCDGQITIFDYLERRTEHTELVRKNEYEPSRCKICGTKCPQWVIYGTWPYQGVRVTKNCPGCNRIVDLPEDLLKIADRSNYCTDNISRCNRTEIWQKAAGDCPQTCCYRCDRDCDVKKELICRYTYNICTFSGHTCNKKHLWELADTFDELLCPHVCCRKCNTRLCGVRCNGSEEPKQPVNIKGICDDAYCPECDYQLDELKELDCEQCPECGTRLDWTPWHRANDE